MVSGFAELEKCRAICSVRWEILRVFVDDVLEVDV